MSVPATGPVWNVEEFPSSYNGTPIEWDPEQFDTAAMPFIVAVRQHFWSWRITRFGVGTGVLEIDVALPSAMPDGATMISFDAGDVDPSDLVGEIGALLFLMLILFVLGFFLEWIEISYIALPMFLPVFIGYGTDMVWLAILVAMNLQMSFLTPPFGWALFFLKGVAPPEVSTRDIYVGVVPFVGLQVLAVALVFLFPGIATWLPQAIGW